MWSGLHRGNRGPFLKCSWNTKCQGGRTVILVLFFSSSPGAARLTNHFKKCCCLSCRHTILYIIYCYFFKAWLSILIQTPVCKVDRLLTLLKPFCLDDFTPPKDCSDNQNSLYCLVYQWKPNIRQHKQKSSPRLPGTSSFPVHRLCFQYFYVWVCLPHHLHSTSFIHIHKLLSSPALS